jgi:hypothetical protein
MRAQRRADAERVKAQEDAHARVPRKAYEVPLSDLSLSSKVYTNLITNGLENAGEVMERIAMGDEALLMLNGVGVKALQEIKQAVEDSGLSLLSTTDVASETDVVAETVTETEEAEVSQVVEETPEAAEGEPATPVDTPVEEPAAPLAVETVEEPVAATAAPESAPEAVVTEEAGETPQPAPGAVPAADVVPAPEGATYEDDEEMEGSDRKKGKGRKRRRTVVFDDTTGETYVVRKRRGRSTDGWDEYSEDY